MVRRDRTKVRVWERRVGVKDGWRDSFETKSLMSRGKSGRLCGDRQSRPLDMLDGTHGIVNASRSHSRAIKTIRTTLFDAICFVVAATALLDDLVVAITTEGVHDVSESFAQVSRRPLGGLRAVVLQLDASDL